MEDFTEWHKRWNEGQTGWHNEQPNEYLCTNFKPLFFKDHPNILIPLCGKSQDLIWLAKQGATVIGVELVEKAIQDFFSQWGMPPTRTTTDGIARYSFGSITIFCADFFSVTRQHTGVIDAVYDRAALVALPPHKRQQYIEHELSFLASGHPLLLISYEMPRSETTGPPFSIKADTVPELYKAAGSVTLLEQHLRSADKDEQLVKRSLPWASTSIWQITK